MCSIRSLVRSQQGRNRESANGTIVPGSGDRYNGMVIPGDEFPDSAKGRFPESTDPSLTYLFRGGKYPDYYSNIQ